MYTVYECQRNSDQTEGRGRMVTFDTVATIDEAVKRVQNQGVMGIGPGEIVEVTYASGPDEFVNGNPVISRNRIYGYRQHPDSRTWSYGFLDFRDLHNDPEWEEYVRLSKKFNKR